MGAIPDFPAMRLDQFSSLPTPMGEIKPTPVMTTRRCVLGTIEFSLRGCLKIRLLVIPAVFKPESTSAKNLDSDLKTAGMTKQGVCLE
jgi:hypothetical protein